MEIEMSDEEAEAYLKAQFARLKAGSIALITLNEGPCVPVLICERTAFDPKTGHSAVLALELTEEHRCKIAIGESVTFNMAISFSSVRWVDVVIE